MITDWRAKFNKETDGATNATFPFGTCPTLSFAVLPSASICTRFSFASPSP
jgi:hypothetical protein